VNFQKRCISAPLIDRNCGLPTPVYWFYTYGA